MTGWMAFSSLRSGVLAVAGLAVTLGAAVAQDYRLQPGDVVDFRIVGNESLSQRAAVTSDGTVRIPLAGQFKAAGQTIDGLRDEIVAALRNTSYPSGVDAQGGAIWNVIYPEGVLVDVAEYQPVYISGDVLTPGAQPFRFGMTVRQAVALAGGYSAFRSRQDPSLDLAGSQDAYLDALSRVTEAQVDILRIQSELANALEPDFAGLAVGDLDAPTVDRIKQTAQQRFQADVDDRVRAKAAISEAIQSAETRAQLLTQSQKNLEAETRNYEEELRRVEELLRKGLTQVARLNDAQRAVFLVSTRSLETSAEVARLQRELVDLRRSLEKVDTDGRMTNLAALQEARVTLSKAQADLGKAMERRNMQSASSLTGDQRPSLMLVRRNGDDFTRSDVGEDVPLMPGDTIEIRLKPQSVRAASSSDAPATDGAREASAR
ncbi:polysaccharide export outer membrane protein [Aureimonas jatrophae]|uniref:Polysaccharide export outer membrane protein n=1 Tax=Aureimonas jatrophae TaxID=1166073 RepID=A0A1H0NL14_9HYPH|nr:polysaccharide export outer membrane protein [Aureimonas jatrophae]